MTAPRLYKRKLKNFLIYPKFQVALIGAQGVVLLITFLVVQLLNNRTLEHIRQIPLKATLSENAYYFQSVDSQIHAISHRMYLAFFVSFLFSTILTVQLSFRLAGPIWRMRTYFREIAENGTKKYPLKFRRGDFFSDLPIVINRALDSLREAKLDRQTGASSDQNL